MIYPFSEIILFLYLNVIFRIFLCELLFLIDFVNVNISLTYIIAWIIYSLYTFYVFRILTRCLLLCYVIKCFQVGLFHFHHFFKVITGILVIQFLVFFRVLQLNTAFLFLAIFKHTLWFSLLTPFSISCNLCRDLY